MALLDRDKEYVCLWSLLLKDAAFFPDEPECPKHVSHMISHYTHACESHLHTTVLAHTRILLNQWCPAWRYGRRAACFFCGDVDGDQLEHILVCKKLHKILELAMNQRMFRPSAETLLLSRHRVMLISSPLVRYFNCYNSCRPWNVFPDRFAKNLKSLGMNVNIIALEKASIAGRVRNALVTFSTCLDWWADVQRAIGGFDRFLKDPPATMAGRLHTWFHA